MFVIKKSQLNLHENSKEFEFENSGMIIKFRPASHPHFRKVNGLIAQYKKQHTQEQSDTEPHDVEPHNTEPHKQDTIKLDKHAIKEFSNDGLDEYEALLYAMGEYLIEDWNITIDDDGKQEKLTPSGDNFMAIINSASDPASLVEWCFECVGKISQEVQEQAIELKKKPSKGGNGNKATKT